MTFYIARQASKLWKRIAAETSTELGMLAEKWKFLLIGIIFQYVHGLAAHGVHYFHRPGPTLQDAGFMILPELGPDRGYVSETLFAVIFLSFFLWSFNPFVFHSKRFYTVNLWCRVLAFLVVSRKLSLLSSLGYHVMGVFPWGFASYFAGLYYPCLLCVGDGRLFLYLSFNMVSQFLRIATFMSTQLPGPNYHCREGSKFARLPPPESISEVFLINFPRGVLFGCGDLIFSSHMIFTLVFVRTYQKYGVQRLIKQLAWISAVMQSLLIIASRKHYTVDVVVAWYTVNLVVYFVDKQLLEDERSIGNQFPLLPINGKEKDGRSKEEIHRLVNGNPGDNIDWRPRGQINGKVMDDGNQVHMNLSTNSV